MKRPIPISQNDGEARTDFIKYFEQASATTNELLEPERVGSAVDVFEIRV